MHSKGAVMVMQPYWKSEYEIKNGIKNYNEINSNYIKYNFLRILSLIFKIITVDIIYYETIVLHPWK